MIADLNSYNSGCLFNLRVLTTTSAKLSGSKPGSTLRTAALRIACIPTADESSAEPAFVDSGCRCASVRVVSCRVMKASDFPPGTKFFDNDNIPVAVTPDGKEYNCISKPSALSKTASMKMDMADPISAEEFDSHVRESDERAKNRSIAATAADK